MPPSGNDMFANGGNAYYAEECVISDLFMRAPC